MEKLFRLIKSLNGMEKRYFRLAVSVHDTEGKNYMQLFDAISRQNVYNEKALRAALGGKAILRRFDMSKNYLYRLVLNTLLNYHRQSSVEQQLLDALEKASILYNKMLYKSCLEVLQKAQKLALRFESYEILLKIIQMISRVAIEEKKDTRFMEPFHQAQQQAFERIQKINEYYKLYHRLYTFFTKKGNDLRVKGVKKEYEKILQHPLLSEQKPNGYEEKNYYYLTFALCYFCLGDARKSYEFTQRRLQLIKSNPERIKENSDAYIITLNSVIFYGSVICKVKESEDAFRRLQEFLFTWPDKHHKIFVAYDNMMALYITAGFFRKGIVYAQMAESELPKYETKLFDSNKVSLYHDMFYVYFGCREYERSLRWLNKLLNETAPGVREDIQMTARITNLVLHYELGNFDLLPYLLRRTFSFLLKRKRLHKLEKILLQFMGKLLHVNPFVKREITALFVEIKEALEKVTQDPHEAMVLTEYFDYISWLESKIENRSFEKIVKEKAAAKLKN
jgi:hypothetical protein